MEFIFEKTRIISSFTNIVKSSNEYVIMSFINATWYVKPPMNSVPSYPPTNNADSDTTVVITLNDELDMMKFYKCMGVAVHIVKVDIDFVIEFNATIRSNNIEILTAASGERFAVIDVALESEALVMRLSIP